VLNAATVALALSALFAVGLRIREFLRPDPMAPKRIPDASSYSTVGHRCPFCQQVEPVLTALRQKYPNDLSITFRHFPLSSHDSAASAARVVECAGEVGDFEVMHHFLFANAKLIGHQRWHWFAAGAGVRDLRGFDRCIEGLVTFPAIERDRVDGERLGVVATPTFLVNNTRYAGYMPLESFEKIVTDAIQESNGDRR
jgi:protein-disulfide isomerase